MAYSELIKDFESIRAYMRDFYVYGFKSRNEYDKKSARSYDNERRRIESWLGEYMSFHYTGNSKNVFLSVDSRTISTNPLYKAFKAKSFTNKDITLHFYILDMLEEGRALTVGEMIEEINRKYLHYFDKPLSFDESTVRKKLKEYVSIGLLCVEKKGREVRYKRTDLPTVSLTSWKDALAFYSEESPLGVIGSFLLDRLQGVPDFFRFKHHYMVHTLDSDILCQLLEAIYTQQRVKLTITNLRNALEYQRSLCPLKIYVSTQSGRQYLLGYHYGSNRIAFFRLDAIKKVEIGCKEECFSHYLQLQQKFDQHLWGVSRGNTQALEHIEMTIHVENDEQFIVQRLKREKRHGTVEMIDEHTYRFVADVYDAAEMLPWLRTFIGRIIDLQCTNPTVEKGFFEDLQTMETLYGDDKHAVS